MVIWFNWNKSYLHCQLSENGNLKISTQFEGLGLTTCNLGSLIKKWLYGVLYLENSCDMFYLECLLCECAFDVPSPGRDRSSYKSQHSISVSHATRHSVCKSVLEIITQIHQL